jgi:hypothetical protein
MKKGEMIALRNVLNQLMNEEGYNEFPVKLCYAVSRTLDHMESEIASLQKMETGIRTQYLKKFDEEREALIKQHGKEQPNGSVAVDEKDETAMAAYTEAFEALKAKYKKDLEKYEKAMEEYQRDILQGEEAESKVHSISLELIPEDFPRRYLHILSSSRFGLIVE